MLNDRPVFYGHYINSKMVDNSKLGRVLLDSDIPLKKRFRALFALRNIGGIEAINDIGKCFSDPSALLKHECAYCLGQMQDLHAIPILLEVLVDTNHETIVRHEAGEAIGAIGDEKCLDILNKYQNLASSNQDIRETCELASSRIRYFLNPDGEKYPDNPYLSVDPAPPSTKLDLKTLGSELVNGNLRLFDRYRALFALRNLGGSEAVALICEGLRDTKSALFRHEVAYVLGQMQHSAAESALCERLSDTNESSMVRHECAEALGSIGTPSCFEILQKFLNDDHQVVRESCEVALDMCEYEMGSELNYTDLSR